MKMGISMELSISMEEMKETVQKSVEQTRPLTHPRRSLLRMRLGRPSVAAGGSATKSVTVRGPWGVRLRLKKLQSLLHS